MSESNAKTSTTPPMWVGLLMCLVGGILMPVGMNNEDSALKIVTVAIAAVLIFGGIVLLGRGGKRKQQ